MKQKRATPIVHYRRAVTKGLVVLLLMLHSRSAISECDTKQQLSVLSNELSKAVGDASQIEKQFQLDYLKRDPIDFCRRNLLLRSASKELKSRADTYSTEKLAVAVTPGPEDTYHTPWDLSLVPTMATRSRATNKVVSELKFNNLQEARAYLAEKRPMNDLKERSASLGSMGPATPDGISSWIFPVAERVACARSDIKEYSSCVKALGWLRKNMWPNGSLIDPAMWKQVFTSEKYKEGLRLSAVRIIDRVEGKVESQANVWDDLRSGFKSAGMSEEEAKEAALNSLSVISTGGQNAYQRIQGTLNYERDQAGIALGLIAVLMTQLDEKKIEAGQPFYSYPENVTTSCDNAKPYHFWMSAYFARKLRQQGYSQDAAISSTFLAEKGYQILRHEIAGGSDNVVGALTKLQSFSPTNQIARADLAYAAAGAAFGANPNTDSNGTKIDVNKALFALVRDANTDQIKENHWTSKPLKLASAFFNWEKLYSPDSALDEIRSQVNGR